MKKTILFLVLAIALVSSFAATAYANHNPPNLQDGYDLTTDAHGIDIPPGTLVTAYAYTTNPLVNRVTFEWKDPASNVVEIDANVAVAPTGDNWNGLPIYLATATFTVQIIGDGSVQAHFQGPG
jgi:hypothetical protein